MSNFQFTEQLDYDEFVAENIGQSLMLWLFIKSQLFKN